MVYDAASNVKAVVDQRGFRTSYTYDALHRMVQVQDAGGGLLTFVYDAASNQTATVDPRGNRTTFAYDAAGDLKGDGTNTYTHGARGRLSSVTLPGGTVSYLYNGLEQRQAKTGPTALVPGGARYYVHDEQGHIVGEYDEAGNPVYEVVYLGDTPVAVITHSPWR